MLAQIDGVLLVDKPQGKTSHDLVDYVRRKFKLPKVGHCGTLDPMATGLLMLVIGRATKVQDLLMAEDKIYAGCMKLGIATDSQDAEGETVATKDVPPLQAADLEQAMAKFQGDIYQTPPMVSAVKKGGVPLYKLARQGKTVEREPRLVHVYYTKLLGWNSPEAEFELKCSKGFYVRTFCHDVGEALGCGAHLNRLKRLRSGNFTLDRAVSWRDLEGADTDSFLVQHVLGLAEVSQIRRQ